MITKISEQLKIAINAQVIPSKGTGGVEQVLIGFVNALGKLEGPEEYVIITPWQNPEWITPYIGKNMVIISAPKRKEKMYLEISKRLLGHRKLLANRLLYSIKQIIGKNNFSVPISNGFYEQLGVDVIHFPYQVFVQTALPSIYNPHDLQHLHFPQFFSQHIIKWRETIYRAGCTKSNIVVVASQWVKQDIIDNYHIDPDKIQVIPWACPTQAFQPPTHDLIFELKSKYELNEPFVLYPAMTWEHKNHLRLLDAIAYLRDYENLTLNLVCTGNKNPEYFPKIEGRLKKLHLNNQIKFLGILPHAELRAIYRLAQFVIIPSLFEAASAPVFEAWLEGTPVACSSATSLPEQVGNAALLFDPISTKDIAVALKKMSTDQKLREELILHGTKRLQDFSWERTAKAYRAVYRLVAGKSLSKEDKMLLSWDWMRESEYKEELIND